MPRKGSDQSCFCFQKKSHFTQTHVIMSEPLTAECTVLKGVLFVIVIVVASRDLDSSRIMYGIHKNLERA